MSHILSFLEKYEALATQAICVWFYQFGTSRAQMSYKLPRVPSVYFWDTWGDSECRKKLFAVYDDLTVKKFKPDSEKTHLKSYIGCQMSIGRIFQAKT